MFKETVEQVGSHPAVLGFVIQNELDSGVVTYVNDQGTNKEAVEFWWAQVEIFAKTAKDNAPGKLIGMAVHDDPDIPEKASSYMAQCPSVDYWGVNTNQPQSFDSVFNSYAGLPSKALKPVVLTEYGFPSTTRPQESQPEGIVSNEATQDEVKTTLSRMIPQAFQDPLCLGVYIFEFCDEWWNQSRYEIKGKPFKPPNIFTWYGGPPAAGFPNGYWDQEGFGLYSIHRGKGLAPGAAIWDQSTNSPVIPIDIHVPRKQVVQAVIEAFAGK